MDTLQRKTGNGTHCNASFRHTVTPVHDSTATHVDHQQSLNNMPSDGCPLEELGLAAQFAAEPAKPAEESGAGGAALADGADPLERLGQEWNRVRVQTTEDGTRRARPARANIGRDSKVAVPPPSIKVAPPSTSATLQRQGSGSSSSSSGSGGSA